jgi:hypothetical protein
MISCGYRPITKDADKVINPIFPGYTLFDMPNTGEIPGTIIRINPQGQTFAVTKIDLNIHLDSVQLRQSSGTKKSDFNSVVGFLGLNHLDISSNDTLNKIKNINYTFTTSGTPIREYVDDLDWGNAYSKILPIIKDDIKRMNRQKDKYYVIRETIKSTGYKLGFGRELNNNSTFKASILKNVVSPNVGLTQNTSDSLFLTFSGLVPYRIFYVKESLTLTTGANGEVGLVHTIVKENE